MPRINLKVCLAILFLFTLIPTPVLAVERINQDQAKLNPQWKLGTKKGMPLQIVPGKKLLFVALKQGGLAILDKDSSHIIAKISTKHLNNLDVTCIARKNNLVYLGLGDFFKARGAKSGLAVVNIDDPNNPLITSLWTSKKKQSGSSCITIGGNHLYLGLLSKGVQIFSLNDPESPKPIVKFQPNIHFPKRNPNRVAHPNVRQILVRENTMFVCYDAGGLRVVDITNKRKPIEVARYINPKMIGKAQAYNGMAIDYPYGYITLDYAGVEVVDLSNLNEIKQVSWWNPWKAGGKTNFWFNSGGHANQIELDKEKKQLFVSAGDSELLVLSVKNPIAPNLIAKVGKRKNKLGVWSMAKVNSTVYLGYIKAFVPFRGTWNGLKAFTIN